MPTDLPAILVVVAWAIVLCTLAIPMSMPQKTDTAITCTAAAVVLALHLAALLLVVVGNA